MRPGETPTVTALPAITERPACLDVREPCGSGPEVAEREGASAPRFRVSGHTGEVQ